MIAARVVVGASSNRKLPGSLWETFKSGLRKGRGASGARWADAAPNGFSRVVWLKLAHSDFAGQSTLSVSPPPGRRCLDGWPHRPES